MTEDDERLKRYENKIKVNPDQRARPNYNWRKHITV